jgi:uncharacterized protein (DUF1810 family)
MEYDDPYDLGRFVSAQADDYPEALAEIRAGRKEGHWIWFVFPQFAGLGRSPMSEYYAIRSLDEARAYLAHPALGPRLVECAEAVLAHPRVPISRFFPYPDDLKLRSSMTLFERVSPPGSVFGRVLDAFFRGERDEKTLALVR